MEFHPIAEIFPLLESDELERLAADIKANGLHHSLWTYEGKILDGRNRWLACQIAGVEPRVRKYEGASPFAFVVSENLERRHLSVTQRVAMAVEGLPMLEAEARGRQEATRAKPGEKIGTNVVPKLEPRSKARDQAGQLFRVSGSSVSAGKQVQQESPELFSEMKSGEITLSEAIQLVKKKKTKERQAKAVEEFAAADIKSVVKVLDIRDATPAKLGIAPDSVDAIITDPPYPSEFLPLFGILAAFAGTILCDGGSLVVMSGEAHLPEVFKLLLSDERMMYQWTMCYLTPGKATQLRGSPVGCNWKPLIWLTKGKYSGPRVRDVFENPEQDKEHHEWGQGEVGMTQIIERMTHPGALVVDPFVGGGTTGVCCVRLGRRFIGFDIDKDSVEIARAGIAKAEHDTPTV